MVFLGLWQYVIEIFSSNEHTRAVSTKMRNALEWLTEHEPGFRKSRLPSLYSDLIQQSASNPDGFAANTTTWIEGLSKAALAGYLPSEQKLILQCSNELLDSLASSTYGRPSGLGIVLDEAIKRDKFVPYNEFVTADQSIYSRSWVPSIGSVLTWPLRRAGFLRNSFDDNGRVKPGSVVLLTNLEFVAARLEHVRLSGLDSALERVMTRHDFAEMVRQRIDISLCGRDEQALLTYLMRDKQMIVYDEHTVKFRGRDEIAPEPLTPEDASIASLSALIVSLKAQTDSLDARIEELQKSARTAVEQKNRQAALSALRSRKLTEQALRSRSETLYKLEEVQLSIQQAADQVAVVTAMRDSAQTLKTLNKQTGGVERVDQILDDLREQMDATSEIGNVLKEPLSADAVLDDAEVDEELKEMESMMKKQEHETTIGDQAKAVDAALAEQRIEAERTKLAHKNTDQKIDESSQLLERLSIAAE